MLLFEINKAADKIEERERNWLKGITSERMNIHLRRKNIRKYYKQFVNGFLATGRISISKTLDSGNVAISFTNDRGKSMTLWLDEQGKVRGISPY